jgi:16S rRNA (cytosine967-C5)-methyltransferase
MQPKDVDELVVLQRDLLAAAIDLVRPGGVVVYAACTLTAAEGPAVGEWLASTIPGIEFVEPPSAPWERVGHGALLLPQRAGTDGMFVLGVRSPSG